MSKANLKRWAFNLFLKSVMSETVRKSDSIGSDSLNLFCCYAVLILFDILLVASFNPYVATLSPIKGSIGTNRPPRQSVIDRRVVIGAQCDLKFLLRDSTQDHCPGRADMTSCILHLPLLPHDCDQKERTVRTASL